VAQDRQSPEGKFTHARDLPCVKALYAPKPYQRPEISYQWATAGILSPQRPHCSISHHSAPQFDKALFNGLYILHLHLQSCRVGTTVALLNQRSNGFLLMQSPGEIDISPIIGFFTFLQLMQMMGQACGVAVTNTGFPSLVTLTFPCFVHIFCHFTLKSHKISGR
jgi:hypothetical protein